MTQSTYNLAGYAAALLNTIQFIPQLVKVIEKRSARDIATSTFLMSALASALWLAYGIHFRSWPVILANVSVLICSAGISLLKLCFDR